MYIRSRKFRRCVVRFCEYLVKVFTTAVLIAIVALLMKLVKKGYSLQQVYPQSEHLYVHKCTLGYVCDINEGLSCSKILRRSVPVIKVVLCSFIVLIYYEVDLVKTKMYVYCWYLYCYYFH